MIYIILIITLALANFIKMSDIKKKRLVLVYFIIFTLLATMRGINVGSDTKYYHNLYTGIGSGRWYYADVESGLKLLCKILFNINTNPQILIIITSIFIYICIYNFIIKNSPNILFSTFLFFSLNFFASSLCLMRQFVALSFALIGFEFLKKNKYIRFIFFVILGSMFHKSVLVLLLLIPVNILSKNKMKKKTMMTILVMVVVLALAFIALTPIMFSVAVRLLSYQKYYYSNYINAAPITGGLYTLVNYVFLLFGIVFYPKSISEDKDYNFYIFTNCIGTLISAMSIRVAIFSRVFLYFNFFNIIFIVLGLENLNNKKMKTVFKILIVISTIIYYFTLKKVDGLGISPYQLFFLGG